MKAPILSLAALIALGAQAGAFAVQTAQDVFTPHDLVNLPRLSSSHPSSDGRHLLSSVSTNGHGSTLYLSSLDKSSPWKEPIAVTEGASSFVWISETTFAYVGKDRTLRTMTVKQSSNVLTLSTPTTLATLPTEIGDLKYHADTHTFAFTAEVWADGDLTTVAEQDRAYADRGDEGLVYDSLYVRHWDTWRGKKSSQIFFFELLKSHGKVAYTASPHFVAPISTSDHATLSIASRVHADVLVLDPQTRPTSPLPLLTRSRTSTSLRRISSSAPRTRT